MTIENLPEIEAFILHQMENRGNPDSAVKKFELEDQTYTEIIEVMKLDRLIEGNKTYFDGTLDLQQAFVTAKGYKLMKKYY